ncbi:xylulokinase [Zavarzinia sp. CC-PAN008]|uniref:xylulokinase n=1 Tax=Zavarzinia sp. CC-PAN008 TaxID=3243332 RepID=UPI003F743949
MTAYLLGVDLGATGLKATIIDDRGVTIAEATRPIPTASPHPGWSEQDPDTWWQAAQRAIRDVLQQFKHGAEAIVGIGLSGGAHIAVLEDEHGQVIRPAIMWNDQRSHAEAAALHERAGDRIIATSLNRANPTWTLCQLAWLNAHEPDVRRRTRRLYIAKDHLRARLTGDWTTDYSDALGALMSDVATRGWSADLAALVDWDPATLPPVGQPTDIAGRVTEAAAMATGLAAGTPVVIGSNDTTVELFGAGANRAGEGAIKLATAGVVFLTTARPEVHPPISCYPHVIDGLWYMASGINACASAHRWVRDTFFSDLSEATAFDTMDRLAAAAPAGSDGLIFHPYLMGERAPHWDPKLKGDFLGLTLRHDRGHFARACYEGISFALNDVLGAAKALSGATFGAMRLVGGGSRSATWRQVLADVTGLPMVRPENGDASFGAALVAGMGVGVFTSTADAQSRMRVRETTEPNAAAHARYGEIYALYDQARRALTPVSHAIHAQTVERAGT